MRRMLFTLIAVAFLGLVISSAGAYFTSRAEIPDNVIRAGVVQVSSEPTSAALSIESLAPGVTVERSLVVVNTGSLPMDAVITCAKKAGITDFYDALQCRATCDGEVLYEGPLAGLRTAPVTLQPGARSRVDFGISLPESAGNDLAGDYVKLSLYVDAEQTH